MKLLVVDDQPDMTYLLGTVLHRWGYQIAVAGGGLEAFALCQQQAFDLLITDIVMEDMDGITMFDQLRRKLPTLRVIFMSGYELEYWQESLAGMGQYGYWQKNADFPALGKLIESIHF